MMCDLCGEEKLHLYKALVEGSIMSVCDKCKKFGEVLSIERPKEGLPRKVVKKQQEVKKSEEEVVEEVIVEDYASKIKSAREERKMTQEELGKAVSEKESMIQKLESGHMIPSIGLAKKLEQFLRIRLIEKYKVAKDDAKGIDFKDEAVTIGDLIRLSKKK